MKTIYTRIPGLGEAYLQIGGAEGRHWLDASLSRGEAQLWVGSSTLQFSAGPSLKGCAMALLAFGLGLSMDIETTEAGTSVILSNASMAILQQFGY